MECHWYGSVIADPARAGNIDHLPIRPYALNLVIRLRMARVGGDDAHRIRNRFPSTVLQCRERFVNIIYFKTEVIYTYPITAFDFRLTSENRQIDVTVR